MERERNDATREKSPTEDAARGPDETGVGATSKSSPQGDGAEKAPARPRTEEPAAGEPA